MTNASHQKLDDVLEVLNKEPKIIKQTNLHEVDPRERAELFWKTANSIAIGVSNKWGLIDEYEVKEILDYSIFVNLVESKVIGAPPILHYKVQYPGRILMEKGGHVGELNRQTAKSRTERCLLQLSAAGAIGAALFAGAYLFWDVAKYAMDSNWFVCCHCCH